LLSLKLIGDASCEFCGHKWMLQHERTLQVNRAMQTAGENEVSLEQRPGFFKPLNDFVSLQRLTSINAVESSSLSLPTRAHSLQTEL
jgi:hypothetical protein